MRRLYELLLQNPILVFILLAWVAGMIGNVAKAVRKGREAAEQQRRMPTAGRPAAPTPAAARTTGPASADEVAAEMRRILGMDPPARTARAPQTSRPKPPPLPPPKPRRLVEPERPPTPVEPALQRRRLEVHVDPHVGEQIARREVGSEPRPEASTIGSLGGRVHRPARRRQVADRYPRTNLRQALVLNEILGPPLALRRPDPPSLR